MFSGSIFQGSYKTLCSQDPILPGPYAPETLYCQDSIVPWCFPLQGPVFLWACFSGTLCSYFSRLICDVTQYTGFNVGRVMHTWWPCLRPKSISRAMPLNGPQPSAKYIKPTQRVINGIKLGLHCKEAFIPAHSWNLGLVTFPRPCA